MFDRPRHQLIAQVLSALDADRLRSYRCYFGGGTAIALRYQEFRESLDMDFMVSDLSAYRALRRHVGGEDGIGALLARRSVVETSAAVRADQYGLRTYLDVADVRIKFEIIFEARIELDGPGADDTICEVSTLTVRDMAATKLLANSDRWADQGVFSRDLIDLAMMEPGPGTWRNALDKAESASGDAIRRDLGNAIKLVRSREAWLDRCMKALSIELPKALLWQRISRLERMAGT